MYRLEHFERNCRVIEDDRVLFAGSFRECEDYLDLLENVRPPKFLKRKRQRSKPLQALRHTTSWAIAFFSRMRTAAD
ncbi:MAG: hypothetical protein M3552_07335 [Planctomycetota bacterium]|nr:hypothetical protein [Planctomycetaceae bacterium]MDQ3330450.1 hypothetical protein [Planctomycetota bacterium]